MTFVVAPRVDFYKTRDNSGNLKNLTTLANKVHKYLYTRPDEDDVDDLFALGGAAGKERGIYFNGMGIWDEEDQANLAKNTAQNCNATSRRNNIGWFKCTATAGYSTSSNGKLFVINVRDDIFSSNSHNWFLRYSTGVNAGKAIRSGTTFSGNVYLDTGNPEVQAKFQEVMNLWVWSNATENLTTPYDYIFFDNLDTRFDAQTTSPVSTLQYGAGDGSAFWLGQLSMIDSMRVYAAGKTGNLGNPGKAYWNLQGHTRSAADMARFKQAYVLPDGSERAGGGMIEFAAISSTGAYKASTQVLSDWEAAEYMLAYGVELFWVCQVPNISNAEANPTSADGLKARFCVAAALMVMAPGMYIRLGESYATYTHLSLFDQIQALGAPLGRYTDQGGGAYRRMYEGGQVDINLTALTSSITYNSATLTKPFPCQPLDRIHPAGSAFVYQMKCSPLGAGAITFSMSSVTGLSINSSTGRITGTPTVPGISTVTVTFAEASGQTVTRTFSLEITGSAETHVIGINCGGAAYTTSNSELFEADPDNVTPHSTVTVNGSTLAAVGTTPTLNGTVPSGMGGANELFRSWRLDNASPWFIYTIPGFNNSYTYKVRLGFNSSTDGAGRLYDVYLNGAFEETVDVATLSGGSNVAFVRTYTGIAPSGGIITVECRKNVSSTGSARLGTIQILQEVISNTVPVITSPGNKTGAENSAMTPFDVTVSSPDGRTALLTATGIPFQLGASFIDNLNGTGTFTWTPGYEDEGLYTVTFIATHPNDPALVDTESITVTISNTNRPPSLTVPTPITLAEGNVLLVPLVGSDPDTQDTLSWSVSGAIAWSTVVTVDDLPYLRLAPTIGTLGASPYAETVTVDDGTTTTDQVISIVITLFIPGVTSYPSSRKRRQRKLSLNLSS